VACGSEIRTVSGLGCRWAVSDGAVSDGAAVAVVALAPSRAATTAATVTTVARLAAERFLMATDLSALSGERLATGRPPHD
jgi:hypothetical protein